MIKRTKDLTGAELKALNRLFDLELSGANPPTYAEFGEMMGYSRQRAHALVGSLRSKGYVEGAAVRSSRTATISEVGMRLVLELRQAPSA